MLSAKIRTKWIIGRTKWIMEYFPYLALVEYRTKWIRIKWGPGVLGIFLWIFLRNFLTNFFYKLLDKNFDEPFWQFFLQNFLTIFFFLRFFSNFCHKSFYEVFYKVFRIFVSYDEFFWWIFSTNFLMNSNFSEGFFMTYNHITITSFRIGVPSILFFMYFYDL